MLTPYDEIEKVFAPTNKKVCGNCPLVGVEPQCSKEKGCCTICVKLKGAFVDGRSFEIAKSNYRFDGVHGFFEPGKGCRIPIRDRSPVCVRFMCVPFVEDVLSRGEFKTEAELRDFVKQKSEVK